MRTSEPSQPPGGRAAEGLNARGAAASRGSSRGRSAGVDEVELGVGVGPVEGGVVDLELAVGRGLGRPGYKAVFRPTGSDETVFRILLFPAVFLGYAGYPWFLLVAEDAGDERRRKNRGIPGAFPKGHRRDGFEGFIISDPGPAPVGSGSHELRNAITKEPCKFAQELSAHLVIR
jgi:hypothetical protein